MQTATFRTTTRVNSYDSALRAYNKVKPLRGTDGIERPFDDRRAKHKMFRKLADGSIAYRLYYTDVVTYHPNGDVTLRLYDSKSTVACMSNLMPINTGVTLHRGRMFVALRSAQGHAHNDWKYYRGSVVKLTRMTAQDNPVLPVQYKLVNPDDMERHTTRRVDRAKSAEVREKIAPFMDWLKTIQALAPDGVLPLELFPDRTARTTHYEMERILAGDHSPEQYVRCAYTVASRLWDGLTQRGYYFRTDPVRQLRDVAYHVAKPFVEVEVPFGELPPDSKW